MSSPESNAARPPPIVAILRGVRPDEAVAHVEALFEAGLRAVEVPLNSPEPFESVRRIVAAFEGRMAIGAGFTMNAASGFNLGATTAGTNNATLSFVNNFTIAKRVFSPPERTAGAGSRSRD